MRLVGALGRRTTSLLLATLLPLPLPPPPLLVGGGGRGTIFDGGRKRMELAEPSGGGNSALLPDASACWVALSKFRALVALWARV